MYSVHLEVPCLDALGVCGVGVGADNTRAGVLEFAPNESSLVLFIFFTPKTPDCLPVLCAKIS